MKKKIFTLAIAAALMLGVGAKPQNIIDPQPWGMSAVKTVATANVPVTPYSVIDPQPW